MDTREFLESLTESALDDGLGWLTIWALSNKRSEHFTAAAAAQRAVAYLSNRERQDLAA